VLQLLLFLRFIVLDLLEFAELQGELLDEYRVVRYEPSETVTSRYKDGGVAIIDQWICAHARYAI